MDAAGWLTPYASTEFENEHGVRPARVYAQTRWDPRQADDTLYGAEQGNLLGVAKILDAMHRDGVITGIMGVRTSGMLRCPAKFSGDPWLVDQLRGRDPVYEPGTDVPIDPGTPGTFWDMFPESEQASMLWDGIMAGVGVGEMVPRAGKPPRLRHLPLHYLKYRYETDFWYYQSRGEPWAVEPGDGRWILFTPYGRERPWIKGMWWPCSLPFITRQNVTFDQLRWCQNLADPLKVIESAPDADEKHRGWLLDFATRLWRRAAALVTPPKYTAKLVESNNRGYEVYQQGYEQAGKDLQIALAGSTVAVEGGSGFVNASIFRDISSDKTAAIAEEWATCLHSQGLRPWTRSQGQPEDRAPWTRWDITSPEQREAEAKALGTLAESVDKLDSMLARRGREVDLSALLEEMGRNLPTRAKGGAHTPAEPLPDNVTPLRRLSA